MFHNLHLCIFSRKHSINTLNILQCYIMAINLTANSFSFHFRRQLIANVFLPCSQSSFVMWVIYMHANKAYLNNPELRYKKIWLCVSKFKHLKKMYPILFFACCFHLLAKVAGNISTVNTMFVSIIMMIRLCFMS